MLEILTWPKGGETEKNNFTSNLLELLGRRNKVSDRGNMKHIQNFDSKSRNANFKDYDQEKTVILKRF
jgi:hypothetical protein